MTKYRGAYLKKQKNILNVKARVVWLMTGLNNPKGIPKTLVDSLNDQRKFSSLAVKGSEIQPISLNTLKNIADEFLLERVNGLCGFPYIDNLRIQLKQASALHLDTRSKERRSARIDETLSDLKLQLQHVELLNLQRSKAYFDFFQRVVSIASDSNLPESLRFRIASIVEDHRDLYMRLIDPTGAGGSHKLRVVQGNKND